MTGNEISSVEIKKIADLARLNLSDAEISLASADISGVLRNFETIRDISTTNVPPADDVSGLQNVMREDIEHDGVLATPEALLKNAKTKDNYVQVSAVFTEETV
ncbi:MAG TPA: Asp-tRNA(Asn)/Glu-tRNA(Gln) amidotransferase subunit GatC [Candidatus Andersenbacteria bacterium]|nr:Asp-tRNA(Asn)/Glu-tRNA(Gln) amidotransferase subunit GatC [Candidatus Andersenbacteria bacterium]